MNFWQELEKPFFVLAPLADVTDAAFRRVIAKYSKWDGKLSLSGGGLARPSAKQLGGPDVMFTEFVSADGLMRATPEGKEKLMADLIYSEEERPIVAQLFSSNPEYMEKAARLCAELGFDGIDINMGCPDRSIEKQGAGAAMMKNPENAQAIIRAAKRGGGGLPVSLKTRLGYDEDVLEEWLPALLSEKPAAVIIHARTRKEMSKVPARWERVKRAVEIRDALGSDTLILGNGDVADMDDAREKAKLFHADGVMLGKAIFGNPYLFHPTKRLPPHMTLSATSSTTHRTSTYDSGADSLLPRSSSQAEILSDKKVKVVSLEERLNVMVKHTKLFVELLPFKNFSVMKKHYKAYVNGFTGAAELRSKLMQTNTPEEAEIIVHDFLAEVHE